MSNSINKLKKVAYKSIRWLSLLPVVFLVGLMPTIVQAHRGAPDEADACVTRVMVMHSSKDRLFPGYGQQAVGWWAACNKCDPIPDKIANGCFSYSGCAGGVKTLYCEGDQIHSHWPERSQDIIEFFVSATQVSPRGAK